MSNMKKAGRMGSAELNAGITAAAAGAKTRLHKLDTQSIDQVAGGVDVGAVVDVIVGGGGAGGVDVTMGMFPSGNEGVGDDD